LDYSRRIFNRSRK